MFYDHRPRGTVLVTKRVSLLLANLTFVGHETTAAANSPDPLRVGAELGAGVERQIDGVGYEALLAGPDGVENTFAGKGFFFEDAEAAAVEREAA